MKNYVLIFRMDLNTPEAQPAPEQMQTYMKDWMSWIDSIAAKNQLAEGGNHFSYTTAKVLRPNDVVTEGPYTMNKESIAGYILVSAKNIEGAVQLAKACPILQGKGTSVEVRETAAPQRM